MEDSQATTDFPYPVKKVRVGVGSVCVCPNGSPRVVFKLNGSVVDDQTQILARNEHEWDGWRAGGGAGRECME